jgi:16S rRNA (uracil1498-N3)-methyltransferase
MRRFLLPRPYDADETFCATGEDYHYLATVLRLREGAVLQAGDAAGGRYRLVLVKREAARLEFRVEKEAASAVDDRDLEIVLCVCLPKPATMDLLVRLTTEAGVDRIAPLTSDFSAVKEREAPRLEERQRRWEKIARAAFQQSGRAALPVVEPIARLADIKAAAPGELAFFADERGEETRALHDLMSGGAYKRARIVIGPEGGFSRPERAALMTRGFAPVFLGKNILRTETAALLTAAAVRLLELEKASWKQK